MKPKTRVSLSEAFQEHGLSRAFIAYLGPDLVQVITVLPVREQNLILVYTSKPEIADKIIGDFDLRHSADVTARTWVNAVLQGSQVSGKGWAAPSHTSPLPKSKPSQKTAEQIEIAALKEQIASLQKRLSLTEALQNICSPFRRRNGQQLISA